MSRKKHITFIVNPISGTSGKNFVLHLIEEYLDRNVYTYDVLKTQHMGHATELAHAAAERGVNVVCAIGGDGTVNEVACGLIHTPSALAIIPSGSGNGLARHLRIPTDPLSAIKIINLGNIQLMDYGIVNLKPFFCTCGVGFDAFISQRFAESKRRGPVSYIENVLNSSLRYHPDTYDIDIINTTNGQEVHKIHKAFLISCANASQYGNNAYIAPSASVRDGLMDVTIIEPFLPIEAPQLAIQLFNGTIEQNSRIKTFQCRKAIIHRTRPGVVHYDGDPLETGETIEVEIVPQGLLCLSPTEEGMPTVEVRVQNFLTEHFKNMYNKTEVLIQENIRKSQRITQLNKELIRKISGK
ncbi:MAG: diacylglycerol kinase family lipid kinase [Bacteroidales bacterium]|nr:diacylglycerol kinase family lipid kinase [Bacteroidales bacterium]